MFRGMEPRDAKIGRRTTVDAESSNFAGDRITGLPEHIIHHIFSFVETIDVIRTSAVSRKWRYLWLSIPFFNFNIHTLWSDPWQFGSIPTIVERFNRFVDWVLLLHNGSTSIEKFQLECLTLENDYSINRWIHVLARRNVKELDLWLNSQFELPFSLVTCESLVRLKLNLSNHSLTLPSLTGFSRLKTLELVCLDLTDETLTQHLITDCSVLENLRMVGCAYCDFKVLRIFSTTLKNLTIDIGAERSDDKNLGKAQLKVACPNLVSLNFMGSHVPDFSFQGLVSLENAFMHVEDSGRLTEKEYGFVLWNTLKGLSNVKALKLSPSFLVFLDAAITTPVAPCASFSNLKSLKLCICLHECYIKPIICLLNGSPNLEALLIQFEEVEWFGQWEFPDKPMTCLTHHLKMVELIDVVGNENELELTRFLLRHGKVLEKMDIIWYKYAEDIQEPMQEIMDYQRSSPNVALTFVRAQSRINILVC